MVVVTSSCLCKKAEGVAQQLLHGLQVEPAPVLHGLQVQPAPVLIESVKDGIEDSLHALHAGEQDLGRVRLRTSTKQRSMALVVRSLRHSRCGKSKNVSSSGKSRSSRRNTEWKSVSFGEFSSWQ